MENFMVDNECILKEVCVEREILLKEVREIKIKMIVDVEEDVKLKVDKLIVNV